MKRWMVFSLLFLTACGPSSWGDIRAEGEAETRKLAYLLHDINTKDQLQKELPRLKKRFNRMADLTLQVRQLKETSPLPENPEPSQASDQLFAELARLYEMPGCRELIESAQIEALQKLEIH
ncbi:MAG: hypothetical protein KGJ02_05090 [Verrucomicrobiota bacterium]|nr:hypothetical protein [Verrucomicrobiota bacterium]